MPNPTNTEDYDFVLYAEMYVNYPTFGPVHQFGGRGTNGEPPIMVTLGYESYIVLTEAEGIRNPAIWYAPAVAWQPLTVDPATLPGSVEDYTFSMQCEMLFPIEDSTVWLPWGHATDGQIGYDRSANLARQFLLEEDERGEESGHRNTVLRYAPKVTWSVWDVSS
ncbi:hypothetical protein PBI_STASIA_6 [Mycobacterium phage Stasia]|uniref:Uncharacterized protein n=1 Tax=Mycobacterium phage Stasia TaxID=1897548 RepID=A0A1D8EUE2_9CAUD|nr:hypothetical protein KIY68_gp06 [Mycobacterium phage Stasia]AOT24663.1 hypothetical protein PBI_STASIA_6 [Mycobacterium phage Stasia]